MSATWNQNRVRRMVMLIEMEDGAQSAWSVEHGSMTVEHQREWDFDFWGTPIHGPHRARITAEGYFEGLYLAPDAYRDAGFVAGELNPATPEIDRE